MGIQKEPSNADVTMMAKAAADAAMDKAEELGFGRLFGLAGVEKAYEVTCKLIALFDVLGEDGMTAFGQALEKAQMFDMLKEAEEALGEEK